MATLKTERLTLTPFRFEDGDDLFSIRGDREAMRYWDWPGDQSVEETRGAARTMGDDMVAGSALYWTARMGAGAFVGVFDLCDIADGQADLGFMVRRALWGRGYAREAATALIAHARTRNLARLAARIHAGNTASLKLLGQLGFVQTAMLTGYEVRPGVHVDCLGFARAL